MKEEDLPLLSDTTTSGNTDHDDGSSNKNKNGIGRKHFKGSENTIVHYVSSVMMTTTCYIAATSKVPGVAFVWSLCGIEMAFLIPFILPAACNIKIQKVYPSNEGKAWIYFVWGLILVSIIAAMASTIQTVIRIL